MFYGPFDSVEIAKELKDTCEDSWRTPACKWLPKPTTPIPTTRRVTTTTTPTTTTTLAPATTVISDSSTDASSNLPLVIVAVIAILAFIAIGISLFCYCKKKKAAGKKEPMTGVTTGSNSASGISSKGATTPKKSQYGKEAAPEKSKIKTPEKSNIKTAMNY
ncbi:hypothetical protein GCK72_004517 [Caenorhabditis remanei]|uniref:Uncharacterized protein n=1 Tax=Caenorhabditis remanei TaxID=31234 RepID=A0A6A5H9Z3_CAERE|nr:hypothetical protein GCK72_004517 [Caenorhabditis remanei]KAF1764568.1 hypothetical protein GCK72_004517 [Caenorhabditis remanei]